jgi:hypothetical protein
VAGVNDEGGSKVKGWFIGLLLGGIAAFILIFSLMVWVYTPIYSGKIAMDESQYSVFKKTIAQNNVTVDSITVLNANEPIVVIFKVRSKTLFPYGHKLTNVGYVMVPLITICGGLAGFSIGVLCEGEEVS